MVAINFQHFKEKAMRMIYVLLAVLYVLSPVDFVPDVIPIIGWLDDIGILGLLGYSLVSSK